MPKFPMTPRGLAQLRKDLREIQAERPKLALVIEAARELGDLSENAEYHAAKEKQSFLEGRMMEIEAKIGQADVIDPTRLSGTRVVFGATVEMEDEDSGAVSRYMIVGDDEADVKAGKISISSPIARGLINKNEGDEVQIRTPGGLRTFEIVAVSFGYID